MLVLFASRRWKRPETPKMPWSKNFDVEEALGRAVEVFWTHGYEATSMRDLLEAMGIQKGSFYDTYGSKHEIYMRALNRFNDRRAPDIVRLGDGRSPREALQALMDFTYSECISKVGKRGCMVLNCALERAPHDPDAAKLVKGSLNAQEKLMSGWISAGQELGEINEDLDPKVIAKSMLAQIMGMRIYSRVGSPKSSIKQLADQAMALLDG